MEEKPKQQIPTWVGLIVIAIAVYGFTKFMPATTTTEKNEIEPPTSIVVPDPHAEALNAMEMTNVSWKKGGFDSVMMLSAKISNKGSRDVKDIRISCQHQGNSGTDIDSSTQVLYENIPAGKSIRISDFNMGFVHSQARSTVCEITDLVIL